MEDRITEHLIEFLVQDFSVEELTDSGEIFTTLEEYLGLSLEEAAPLVLGAIAVQMARINHPEQHIGAAAIH